MKRNSIIALNIVVAFSAILLSQINELFLLLFAINIFSLWLIDEDSEITALTGVKK